ncbi:hypothetical protein DYB30_004421 [Aphanomyces astaci]|uniref:Transposase MuDR plant domain-containing protein n=1 Tax=Aphanomyces astaci TaxID=112090 RepID=A0A397C8W7_APHAT|nr:hypothetical protein DYB30_004421 [Aphanomyces astaci]
MPSPTAAAAASAMVQGAIEAELAKDVFKQKPYGHHQFPVDIVVSDGPAVHAHVDPAIAGVPSEAALPPSLPASIAPLPVSGDGTTPFEDSLNLHAAGVEADGGIMHDAVNDDDLNEDIEVIPPSEAYLAQCYALGILSRVKFNDLDSFDLLKDKVRQLALRSGFRVRVQRPSSGHRRVWICKSKPQCPFAIIGNKNRRGVSLVTKLAHNHTLHSTADGVPALSLCEATTQEMATFVRNSDLYATSPAVAKITAQQISDVVHAKTGYHINAMRASRIKHLLLADPEQYTAAGMSVQCPKATAASTTTGITGWKSLAEAVWDGFMLVVNDPVTVQSVGIVAVKKMVSTFKKPFHKETLRSIVLMSCPNPEAPPSTTTNRPSPIKFLDAFHRHEQFGFFE